MAEERNALGHPGTLDGIDVSQVQGRIDWPRVAAAGFRFAVIKASEGTSYCDPTALRNISEARAAGLRASVYMFARVSQANPEAQADRLWACMGDTMPSFRPTLDLESAPDDWTGDRIVEAGEDFARALERRFGRLPIVYSYPAFLRRLGPRLQSSMLGECPLWLAQYRSTSVAWAPPAGVGPNFLPPWHTWAMWQYSGNGGYRVPGVPGDCDRNLFNGDEAAFRYFCGLTDPDAPTQPELPNAASSPTLYPSVVHPRLYDAEWTRPIEIHDDDGDE